MTQKAVTVLLRGGLNLVTPPIAIPPGQAIAAINYEPDIAGYTRVGGYERFDGSARPSDSTDAATIAARRAAISEVPGTGPVRGVTVYAGHIYAFRDSLAGEGKMYRESDAGWVEMTFGSVIEFTDGSAEFVEGEGLTGGTSGATAMIRRVAMQSGDWDDGTASGYIVVSDVAGTFTAETITSSSGSATSASANPVALPNGGYYDFTVHNFYGAARLPRLYFANGTGYAFEWDGEVLSPIRTGTSTGILEVVSAVLAANGDRILAANGDRIIMPAQYDTPIFINHYKNHLFLGFASGSLIFSSLGEPLQYLTTTDAGEISFGDRITGLLTSAATSLVIFGQNRIEYVTGNDSSDFVMQPITDGAGAVAHSVQMLNRPVYLDDGGIRDLGTTASFGDWRTGSLTQTVDPLMKAKRDSGIGVAASLSVKGKDQYRLLFDDGTGVTLYIGRKAPEALPFNLPIDTFCACSGEVTIGAGDRLFIGANDGFVYEMDRGLSFDGASIKAYVRLPFNSIGSPNQNKRYNKATIEINNPDDIEVGLAFDVDYSIGLGGSPESIDINAGSAIITTDYYDDIDWMVPVQGVLEAHIDGIGRNIALSIFTEADDKRSHTLSSATFNFSPRGLVR